MHPHIMVPLVGSSEELDHQLALIHNAAARTEAATGVKGGLACQSSCHCAACRKLDPCRASGVPLCGCMRLP